MNRTDIATPAPDPVETGVGAGVGRPEGRAWSHPIGSLIRATRSPMSLWLAVLAANAAFLPYRSRFHDSLLYGFQLQNAAEGGRFQDDLFLLYGSQDRYSIFSLAAAPLARVVGVQPALFLLYLLATSLIFLAAMRLIRRLIPDRIEVAAGLLLLAVSQPVVGGLATFHVNESFLTARLPAQALVLFGLERLVSGHPLTALLLQLAALTVHPLMAFGGLLLTMTWFALRLVRRRELPYLAAAAALLAVAVGSLANGAVARILAPIDDLWLTEVRQYSPYMFVDEWLADDWLTLLLSVLIVVYARWRLSPDRAAARLLTAVLAVTAMAVAGSLVVLQAPFALILQGQPFRALWLVQALAVPLGVPVARDLWSRGDGPKRLAAVVLFWSLGQGSFRDPAILPILLIAGVAESLRGTARAPRLPSGLWRCLTLILSATIVIQAVVVFVAVVQFVPCFEGLIEPAFVLQAPLTIVPPVLRAAMAVGLLAGIACLAGTGRVFRIAALTAFLVVQASWYRLEAPEPSGTWARADGAAVRFVRGYLETRGPGPARPPTVYWPSGHVDLLWDDLGVRSYYAIYQLAGNVFRRETAVEGRRRAERVRPFEVELGRRRRVLEPLDRPSLPERIFGVGLQGDPPGLADLRLLCEDEGLDYAVLRQRFDGWYDAHDGEWFLYDARAVRQRGRSDAPAPRVAGPVQASQPPLEGGARG